MDLGFLIVISVAVFLFILGTAAIIAKFYRKVEQGKALIVNKMKADPDVTFTGAVVLPIIHKAEIMDISVKTIEIDRRGKEGLICGDNIRADIKVTFFVRVNKTREDVIKVAQAIGCVRASAQETLEELFIAKFSEALKTVGKQLDFIDLYTKRNDFRDRIIEVIGTDLNGYALEDAAIDFLEQTPLKELDEHNILDAQGIRKITELTTIEHVRTNQFENTEKKLLKKQDVEAAEAIYELERQEADAKAKQEREIATVQARESAETLKIEAEERLRSESARIKSDQELGVQEQNKAREVEVAEKNRQRVVLVETERVEKDRALEAIARERETELQRIAKEKAIEVEKKAIADVVRQRVAVDKTVAEEEERIKELRVVEEAKRTKEATIITAEAEAQELLVKDIKAAEAAEQASRHKAKERLTLADAELEASDREAKAKIRLAEGIQAEAAAAGLAEARVKEADAIASEKHGLALVRVKEADAGAVEKLGAAEAQVLLRKGESEGEAIKLRLVGEAAGLTDKAEAMKALDEASRGHEEYRLRIETSKAVQLEDIRARRQVAHKQAEVLAAALKNAKVDIVGGDGVFFDKLVNAVSMGKSVDGFFGRSETATQLVGDYLTGDASLREDLKEVLTGSKLSTQDVENLTVSALAARLLAKGDKAKLRSLLEKAQSMKSESPPKAE